MQYPSRQPACGRSVPLSEPSPSPGRETVRTPIRTLVVDDYAPWRQFLRCTLRMHDEFEAVTECGDGPEAIQKAKELQPDLILLDIGLPTLNGIEAARHIREVSPGSKILFVSECRSADIAEAALNTGGRGYVVKSDVTGDLSVAVDAVVKGERFLSASLGDGNVPLHTGTSKSEDKTDDDSCRRFAESAWISESLKSLIHASGADF